MENHPQSEPWVHLAEMIREGTPGEVDQYLETLSPSETARAVSRLDEEGRKTLLEMLKVPDAAEMLLDLPDEQVADLLEQIEPERAARIVNLMPGEEQADILADVDEQSAREILNEMTVDRASAARKLLEYPEDSAGGIMTTEYLAYPVSWTIGQVIKDLRQRQDVYSDYEIQYIYVVSGAGQLKGVLRLRDIVLAAETARLDQLMLRAPIFVRVTEPLDDLIQVFEEHPFLGVPVIDGGGMLVGVLRRSALREAAGERDRDSYLKASGIVGGEELRSMPLWERSRRRLSWLSINIVLNVLAASVIAFYQDTLSSVIALAVFLPIISDMSGCSGNQAGAVSIRELTLGLVKPYEFTRVFLKEAGLGIINGLALGCLLGGVAYLWKGNAWLGLVVGGALAVNTFVAVCLGGLIPLYLKWIKKDPALASGPLLTTVTDMCGFFFALSFATALLPHIS